jgi:hypothetical protein
MRWLVASPASSRDARKESGCAVFLDGELAGAYGAQDGLYLRAPFLQGSPNQGMRSISGPRNDTATASPRLKPLRGSFPTSRADRDGGEVKST